MPAHAHRQIRRARAPFGMLREDVLDDAVLQRVVADDHQAPARGEPPHRRLKARSQNVQLRVHLDAQRLERPLGRMASRPAGGRGDGRLDDFHQVLARLDGALLALPADELRDAAGPTLVRVLADDPSEICCVVGVNDLCCVQGLFTRIHPHIKGAVLLKGEAARRRVNLHGRDS